MESTPLLDRAGRRRTFSTGEQRLSEWMAANTLVLDSVAVSVGARGSLDRQFDLPLNLDQNIRNA